MAETEQECLERERLRRVEDRLAEISASLCEIRAGLLGSFQEGGLCARVEAAESAVTRAWRKLDRLAVVVVGNGAPGLDERVRSLEQSKRRMDRLGWLLAATLVAEAGVLARDFILGG